MTLYRHIKVSLSIYEDLLTCMDFYKHVKGSKESVQVSLDIYKSL